MKGLSRILGLLQRFVEPWPGGYREELREGHQRIGRALEDLGRAQLALGKIEEAEDHLREARDVLIGAFHSDHLAVAEIEVSLAAALAQLDREAEARAIVDHAEPILRDKLVPQARLLRELGDVTGSLLDTTSSTKARQQA